MAPTKALKAAKTAKADLAKGAAPVKGKAKKAVVPEMLSPKPPIPPHQHNLPLFFNAPCIVNANRHAKAGISPTKDYGFTRDVNSVPVNSIEFIEAAKHYPIVFTNLEKLQPVVILGFEHTNYFVDTEGHWRTGAYIPAYIRQYPFIFFEQPQEQRFYLCVDEEAKNFHAHGKHGSTPLYNDDGSPSQLSVHALDFCTAFYQHRAVTEHMCADLVTHNLLIPMQSSAKLANGKTFNLSGFMMIDEKAFNALPQEVFMEFRQKGWLAFIYFALLSTGNWKHLMDIAK